MSLVLRLTNFPSFSSILLTDWSVVVTVSVGIGFPLAKQGIVLLSPAAAYTYSVDGFVNFGAPVEIKKKLQFLQQK